MQRRLVVASAIAVATTAAFLPGSGFGSSAAAVRGAQEIPTGLAAAIHARLGAGTIRLGRAPHITAGPELGDSVALSADGTTAIVGATGVDRGKGAAYIFHVSDAGSWSSSETPTAVLMNKPGPARNQQFGWAVALSAAGTTAFVDAGRKTYAFHVSAEDAWASSSTPTATLSARHLVGPLAVSPDGTTLIAGAGFYDAGAGEAYVFHVPSEGAWASTSTPTATLSNASQNPKDTGAAEAVAISGDGTTALVADSPDSSGGGAYVFHVSAANAWTTSSTPTAILSDANRAGYDRLGGAVSLSDDGIVAFLGAPFADSGRGAVDVFHTSAETAWTSTSIPTATLTNSGGPANDGLGLSVGVSTDGTTALVTAIGADGGGAWPGAAYIFRATAEDAWASTSAPTATLTHGGRHTNDFLGIGGALSADGTTVLVGVPGARFWTGAADVFHVSNATSWASSSKPTAILTVSALERCVVPRLMGKTVSAARLELRARSCRLGKVRRVVQPKARKGRVFHQGRWPGVRLPVGTEVSVKVAR